MDCALILRQNHDLDIEMVDQEIDDLLSSSDLIFEITSQSTTKPLPMIWKLIALSEIPYSSRLAYTQHLIQTVEHTLFTGYGFALSRKKQDMVSCYNAMVIESLCKLGYAHLDSVKKGVEWIIQYQPFDRNDASQWNEPGVKKYGGCFKQTPCFIGVVKSLKALVQFRLHGYQSNEIDAVIEKGMDYVLKHRLYKRLSNGEPIYKHILDIAYPASYQLNVMELLELAYLTQRIDDPMCDELKAYIDSKLTKWGYWKTNYIYKAEGYTSFDRRGKKAEWVTYLIKHYLGEKDD